MTTSSPPEATLPELIKNPTPEARLEALLYQYITLYERWAEDRQALLEQSEDLTAMLTQFQQDAKELRQLWPRLNHQLLQALETSLQNIATTVTDATAKEATKASKQLARQLETTVSHAERTLNQYQVSFLHTHWKIFGVATLIATLVCLIMVKTMIPTPVAPLTHADLMVYRDGQFLNSFWDKLTDTQKQWLTDLANNKHKNNGRALESLQDAPQMYVNG